MSFLVSPSSICVAALSVGIFLLVPTTITSLFKYHKISSSIKSKTKFFQSREPSLVILINVLSMTILSIERPLVAFFNVFPFSSHYPEINLYRWVFEVIHSVTWFGLLMSLCIKFYLLYFNQQLSLAIINQTWQEQINTGVTDWYIVNSQKWGNWSWLVKISCIPYFVLITFAVLDDIIIAQDKYNDNFARDFSLDMINSIVLFICVILGICIRHKTRYLSDIYGIRDEITFQTIIILLYLIIVIFLAIAKRVPLQLKWQLFDHDQVAIIYAISIISSLILLFCIKQSSIDYPMKRYNKECVPKSHLSKRTRNKKELHLKGKKQGKKGLQQSGNQLQDASRNARSFSKLYSLESIIANETGFRLFMQHLASEFSTELVQIKQEYQKAHGNVLRLPRMVTLPPEMKLIGSKRSRASMVAINSPLSDVTSSDEQLQIEINDVFTSDKTTAKAITNLNEMSAVTEEDVNEAVFISMQSLRNEEKYMTVDFDQLHNSDSSRARRLKRADSSTFEAKYKSDRNKDNSKDNKSSNSKQTRAMTAPFVPQPQTPPLLLKKSSSTYSVCRYDEKTNDYDHDKSFQNKSFDNNLRKMFTSIHQLSSSQNIPVNSKVEMNIGNDSGDNTSDNCQDTDDAIRSALGTNHNTTTNTNTTSHSINNSVINSAKSHSIRIPTSGTATMRSANLGEHTSGTCSGHETTEQQHQSRQSGQRGHDRRGQIQGDPEITEQTSGGNDIDNENENYIPTFSELQATIVPTIRSVDEILSGLDVDKRGHAQKQQVTYLFGHGGNVVSQIVLPPGLPISRLLLANDNLFDRMESLYEKYVKPGSLLEINISSEMRQFLTQFFDKPKEQVKKYFGLTMHQGQLSADLDNPLHDNVIDLVMSNKDKGEQTPEPNDPHNESPSLPGEGIFSTPPPPIASIEGEIQSTHNSVNLAIDRKRSELCGSYLQTPAVQTVGMINDNINSKDVHVSGDNTKNDNINQHDNQDDIKGIEIINSENDKNSKYNNIEIEEIDEIDNMNRKKNIKATHSGADEIVNININTGNCDTMDSELSTSITAQMQHSTSSYLKRLNRLAFNVFDQTALELLHLMNHSYSRFCRTQQFKKYLKTL